MGETCGSLRDSRPQSSSQEVSQGLNQPRSARTEILRAGLQWCHREHIFLIPGQNLPFYPMPATSHAFTVHSKNPPPFPKPLLVCQVLQPATSFAALFWNPSCGDLSRTALTAHTAAEARGWSTANLLTTRTSRLFCAES